MLSKRSTATLLGYAFALSGCFPPDPHVGANPPVTPHRSATVSAENKSRVIPYKSEAECVQAGNNQAVCQLAFEQARTQWSAEAPRFSNIQECTAKTGVACENLNTEDGDWVIPALAGAAIGYGLSGNDTKVVVVRPKMKPAAAGGTSNSFNSAKSDQANNPSSSQSAQKNSASERNQDARRSRGSSSSLGFGRRRGR